MFNQILNRIRSRTREEWVGALKEKSVGLRVWIQEHPELSTMIAFLLGISSVLFHKPLISFLFLTAVLIVVFLLIAPGSPEARGGASTRNDQNRSEKVNGASPGSDN